MSFEDWLNELGGIVHRHVARDAGWSDRAVRAAVGRAHVRSIRRAWVATDAAPADLVAAAEAGGRIACVTLARERGWWMPAPADSRRHLSLLPHARLGSVQADDVLHWSRPLAPASAYSLRESVEDALAHIARCLPPEQARVLWESAIRVERLSVQALHNVRWATSAAKALSHEVTGLCDSGLETIFHRRLGPWRLPIRQQVILAGHHVDFLIGELLVVQIDGFAHHSTAAHRGRDVRHDAELRLRGYTVLRFTYAQVLHDWTEVERAIARAVAAGLHQAPRRR